MISLFLIMYSGESWTKYVQNSAFCVSAAAKEGTMRMRLCRLSLQSAAHITTNDAAFATDIYPLAGINTISCSNVTSRPLTSHGATSLTIYNMHDV